MFDWFDLFFQLKQYFSYGTIQWTVLTDVWSSAINKCSLRDAVAFNIRWEFTQDSDNIYHIKRHIQGTNSFLTSPVVYTYELIHINDVHTFWRLSSLHSWIQIILRILGKTMQTWILLIIQNSNQQVDNLSTTFWKRWIVCQPASAVLVSFPPYSIFVHIIQ